MNFICQETSVYLSVDGVFCSLLIHVDPLQAEYKPGTTPGVELKSGIVKPGMVRKS